MGVKLGTSRRGIDWRVLEDRVLRRIFGRKKEISRRLQKFS
jgi:hypothetical protein